MDIDFRLVKLCKQEFRVLKYGNQFPENEHLYEENIQYIYISNDVGFICSHVDNTGKVYYPRTET